MLNKYRERLRMNLEFQSTDSTEIQYDTDPSVYSELIKAYHLIEMKAHSDFETSANLLCWINTNIHHTGNYDNSDRQDALSLLKVAYQTNYGIHCLAMSTILCECLLSLGIRARVIYMMPEAVEDGDCHVVVEAYISEFKKWIMLDPTYGSYCTDSKGMILNLYEIRNLIVSGEDYRFSDGLNYNGETDLDILDLKEYYSKNLFFFRCKRIQTYGIHAEFGEMTEIAPVNFDVHHRMVENLQYQIRNYGEMPFIIQWLNYEKQLKNTYISIEVLYR